MARIRSVHPDLRISETCAAWPREARYAWVLLWGYLDDYGRGLDNTRLIAADCFPLDDDVTPALVGEWLDLFEGAGSICRYEVGGKRYLHATGWGEFQKPQHPTKRPLPACPCCDATEPVDNPDAEGDRASSQVSDEHRVSGGSPETVMPPSPPRGRGRGKLEKEGEGEASAAAPVADSPPLPPLYLDHCTAHAHIAVPPACGFCKETRERNRAAGRAQHLQLVTGPTPTPPPAMPLVGAGVCRVHYGGVVGSCTGCAADAKAAQ